MPTNRQFSVAIIVGGAELPEYDKDNWTYVESNLSTPISYRLTESELVNGEIEKQEWPVTPYRIKISTRPSLSGIYYFRVLVDGEKVKAISLGANGVGLIKGFRDGAVVREFLFSMPRFAKDFDDRLDAAREHDVGCVEVQCWEAELRTTRWRPRQKPLKFSQANKKDVTRVTKGDYTMATSKAGKAVSHRAILRKVDSWRRTELVSSIKIHYRMGHTLQEMGFTLRPCPVKAPAEPTPGTSGNQSALKRELDDNVIKLDDDDAPIQAVSGVVDLTMDSDDDMTGVESSVVESRAETARAQPAEDEDNDLICIGNVSEVPETQATNSDTPLEIACRDAPQAETVAVDNSDDEQRSSSSDRADDHGRDEEASFSGINEAGEPGASKNKSSTERTPSPPMQCEDVTTPQELSGTPMQLEDSASANASVSTDITANATANPRMESVDNASDDLSKSPPMESVDSAPANASKSPPMESVDSAPADAPVTPPMLCDDTNTSAKPLDSPRKCDTVAPSIVTSGSPGPEPCKTRDNEIISAVTAESTINDHFMSMDSGIQGSVETIDEGDMLAESQDTCKDSNGESGLEVNDVDDASSSV